MRLSREFSPDLVYELNHVLLLPAVHESFPQNVRSCNGPFVMRNDASVDLPVSRDVEGFHLVVVVVVVVVVVFELRSLRKANIGSDEWNAFKC